MPEKKKVMFQLDWGFAETLRITGRHSGRNFNQIFLDLFERGVKEAFNEARDKLKMLDNGMVTANDETGKKMLREMRKYYLDQLNAYTPLIAYFREWSMKKNGIDQLEDGLDGWENEVGVVQDVTEFVNSDLEE